MTRGISSGSLSKLSYKDQVRFVLFCSDQVTQDYIDVPQVIRCRQAINNWLEDKATASQCKEAVAHLQYYLNNVSPHVLYTLVDAGRIVYLVFEDDGSVFAADVADDILQFSKNPTKMLKQQREYFKELLYIDNMLEDIILKGK